MLRGAFQLLAGLAVLLFLLGGSGGGGAFEGGELGLYGGDTVLASYGGGLGFGDGGLGFGEGAEGDFGDCFLGGFLGIELDMVFGGCVWGSYFISAFIAAGPTAVFPLPH